MNCLDDDGFELGVELEDESDNLLPDGYYFVLDINNRVRSVES